MTCAAMGTRRRGFVVAEVEALAALERQGDLEALQATAAAREDTADVEVVKEGPSCKPRLGARNARRC